MIFYHSITHFHFIAFPGLLLESLWDNDHFSPGGKESMQSMEITFSHLQQVCLGISKVRPISACFRGNHFLLWLSNAFFPLPLIGPITPSCLGVARGVSHGPQWRKWSWRWWWSTCPQRATQHPLRCLFLTIISHHTQSTRLIGRWSPTHYEVH